MSKSMHHLRNSAKWLLPILGVILIITWLIVPAIQQAMESTRGPNPEGDAVVVTWTGGSVKRSQLNRMRQERYAAAQFVQLLIQRTQENKGEPRQAPISGNLSDGDVMDALLFANKAQEMGVIVDDNSVKDYLRAICDYPPAAEQESIWADAAARVAKTQNIDASRLFERLKLELAALQGRQLLTTGTASVPLGGLWASHLRVQRQVRIEAYPFPVADYLERVTEKPTDAEQRKIFDEGRSSVENPQSPTPGFMQPDRAVVQYARLDFEPFLEEAKRGFTEEQIAAEYEKMKTAGSFKIPELPVEVELPNPFENLDPAALIPPAPVTPPTPSNPEGAAPGKPEPPRPPAEEGDAPAAPKLEAPKADAPKADAPKADAPKADAPKQSRLGPGGVVYVAAQADEKADPAAKTPPVEVKPAEVKPAEVKPAEVKPVEVQPVVTPPAVTPPAEVKPAGRPPRYRPLTEVREEVLDALASPKAAESRVEFLQKLYSAVDAYARKYTRWESLQTRDGKTDKATLDPTKNDGPGELPIAALLATRKLKLETTPLISPFEAEPFPIARVQGFFDAAFDPRVGLYMPSTIPWNVQSDAAGVRGSREPAYILWKSKFVEHKQLEFGEAKEKVIAAWKKEKAAKLAAADAKALAEKGASTPSLRDVAPDAKRVIAPPAFASVNLGALFGGAEFSPVTGVENAGDEFMEAVFSTQVGKTSSAPDSRHNVYYAIRLIADDSNITDMRQRFAEQGMAFVTNQLAQMEAMRLNMKVLSESLKPYQVKWLLPPLGGDSSFE